jgi:hypothetical protein
MSGHVGDLSEAQQQMLDKMKDKLNTIETPLLDIKNKIMDDPVILRFLRARQFDFDKSYEMIMGMLKWRNEFQGISVAGINPAMCLNELKTGKSFFFGYDKKGRPVTYVRARLHDPGQVDALENQRFTVLQMEFGRVAMMPPPVETATVVFDMTGCSLKNIDMQSCKFMINTFANYYPETLGQVLIYDAPWIVNGAWKVIRPWLDPVTASKVFFISKGVLPDYINEDQLPVDYGGTAPFKYDYATYRALVEKVIPSPVTPNPAV